MIIGRAKKDRSGASKGLVLFGCLKVLVSSYLIIKMRENGVFCGDTRKKRRDTSEILAGR